MTGDSTKETPYRHSSFVWPWLPYPKCLTEPRDIPSGIMGNAGRTCANRTQKGAFGGFKIICLYNAVSQLKCRLVMRKVPDLIDDSF